MIVIYASCGEGHRKAAQALRETLCCESFDILDFAPKLVKKIYSFGYRFVVSKCGFLWMLIFEVSKYSLIRKLIATLHVGIFKKFFVFILGMKPKIIISTHFFSPPLIARTKKEFNVTSLVLVTDLRVHPFWIEKDVDLYFVPLDETREDLIKLGISQERIVVSGLPLRKGFYQEPKPDILRKEFSLEDKPALLIFSSDVGNIPFVGKMLKALKDDFVLFVIYGRNNSLKRFLKKNKGNSLRALSYYENIWELMSLSLAIVTKPGGLTVFEALKLKKPLIFTHYIWGQEKGNMDIAIKLGAGFYVKNIQELKKKLDCLRENIHTIRADVFPEVKDARKIVKDCVQEILANQNSN